MVLEACVVYCLIIHVGLSFWPFRVCVYTFPSQWTDRWSNVIMWGRRLRERDRERESWSIGHSMNCFSLSLTLSVYPGFLSLFEFFPSLFLNLCLFFIHSKVFLRNGNLAVNFINVKRTNSSYEHTFWQLLLRTCN
jgi:hypothetical protein